MARKNHWPKPLLQELKERVGPDERKKWYPYKKLVTNLTIDLEDEDILAIRGTVKWTYGYHTEISWFTDGESILDIDCSCPAFERYDVCKHLVGLWLYAVESWAFDEHIAAVHEKDEEIQWVKIEEKNAIMKDRIREISLALDELQYPKIKEIVHNALTTIKINFMDLTYYQYKYKQTHIKNDFLNNIDIFIQLYTTNNHYKKAVLSSKLISVLEDIDKSWKWTLHPNRWFIQKIISESKTSQYLGYFDQLSKKKASNLKSSNSTPSKQYTYSLRIEQRNIQFHLALIQHTLLKNWKLSKGKLIKAEKFADLDLPEELLWILALTDRYRNYSKADTIPFARAANTIIPLLRTQQQLFWYQNTTQEIHWREVDSSLIYVLKKTHDGNFLIHGDLVYKNERLGRDTATNIGLRTSYHEKSWYRLITNKKDQLYFFQSPAPKELVKQLFWSGIIMTPEQFTDFQKTPWFTSFVEHLEDTTAVIWELIEPRDPSMMVTIKFDEHYASMTSEILFWYDESLNTKIELGDFRYYFSPGNSQRYIKSLDGALYAREFDQEASLMKPILELFSKRYDDVDPIMWVARKTIDASADAFFDELDTYIADWLTVAYYQDTKKVSGTPVSLSVKVASGIDRFDTEIALEQGWITIDESEIIRDALARKESLVTLKDWTLIKLRDDLVQARQQLESMGLNVNKSWPQRIHQGQVWLMTDEKNMSFDLDKHAQALQHKLKTFEGISTTKIPKTIKASLRPYQKTWVNRLNFLREYGFSGILADDMGLGKTLQAITLLASHHQIKENKKKISLVACPTSLVYNRYDECKKFYPTLKVSIIRSWKELLDAPEFKWTQLFIISYGILSNKVMSGELDETVFDYLILDESQHIKNPKSLRAKSICQIQASYRLALSGTPIENNIAELRSVFNFLMPGFLGTLGKFQKQRMTWDPDLSLLSRKVKPFILRRKKEDVLKDLPPKVEEVIVLEMEPKQRALYDKLEKTYKHEIFNKIEEEWLNKSRFQVLDALLKLRQVCLSPTLLKLTWNKVTQSAKLSYLKENIQDMIHSGHSLLIFSQFTWFLSKVKEVLEEQSIPYLSLDGTTPSKKRKELVNTFNEWTTKVFIISLKAWGTGLNLVAADYVIHMDPRRNPAVQQQATDRAHRMGQKKTVFVKKLIMKDSIEEKILQLQEKKKKLIDDIFSGDFSGSLTEDDIQFVFSK